MQNTKIRVLTGITTTGTPHLGNYAGAIRPAIEASRQPNVDAYFFMADYHALIKCEDPARVARSRLEIAATWLAGGLDHDNVMFYRQSDIPEIPELCWLLTCVTPKGLMNRAHAYKASVDQNLAREVDPDDGVTMGLFSYPVLMAADILMFNANKVPVGRDQVQHLEMARDIAQRFNHLYGQGREYFVLPEVQIDDDVATLPGLDGRKMSKSYNNTIPLFEGGSKAMRQAVMRIVTDSRQPGEPKDPDSAHVYALYRAFASADQTASFRAALEGGLGWGEAKEALFVLLDGIVAPMRDRYESLMANPRQIEDILQAGATKARKQSAELMSALREAVGLRQPQASTAKLASAKSKSGKAARLVSFREADRFHFRLLAADGTELLLSEGFENPKVAGQMMAVLKQQPLDQLVTLDGDQVVVHVNGQRVCTFAQEKMAPVSEAIASFQQD
ncbi:MAG: tryptophan--tRNA ligase [Pusillimonas sp.]